MTDTPLVSVIVIFLNAERFLEEAVESVLFQTYPHWELLLVDDGSTDRSPRIAQSYGLKIPEKVRYLSHEGHTNRGMSASRNLGIARAQGEYVAFLDADDVWLPQKLDEQVAILSECSDAAMVYGQSLWWHSWDEQAKVDSQDYVQVLGAPGNTLVDPPRAFDQFFISQRWAIPGPTDILVRREVCDLVGGFDESFQGSNEVYEDQTFFAKVALNWPIFVAERCWDKYRQHPDSRSAVVERSGLKYSTRRYFLNWLLQYLAQQGLRNSDLWRRLRRQVWIYRFPLLFEAARFIRTTSSSVMGLLKTVGWHVLPNGARRWVQTNLQYLRRWPPIGWVRFGSLKRLTPISQDWGFDRGNPVDRYYIESFLEQHRADIRGRVLEVADDSYTRRFGNGQVVRSDILDLDHENPRATIIADLADARNLDPDAFNCIIVTQTLQLLYDVHAAVQNLHRILAPGGVLLVTVPGITQVCRDDKDQWRHYWSFTANSARRLFEAVFPARNIDLQTFGNVKAATAFLYGLAAEDLTTLDLDFLDRDFEVIIAVRAVKDRPGS